MTAANPIQIVARRVHVRGRYVRAMTRATVGGLGGL